MNFDLKKRSIETRQLEEERSEGKGCSVRSLGRENGVTVMRIWRDDRDEGRGRESAVWGRSVTEVGG